jgi:hypothetical protein
MKGLACMAIVVVASCCSAGALAEKAGDAGRIVAYLAELARNRQFLEQWVARETAGEPALAAVSADAMKGHRYDELGRRLAPVIDSRLSDADAAQCIAFIGSPTADKALDAMEIAQGDTRKLMAGLSTREGEQVLAFLDASCVKTVIAAMGSPEGQKVVEEYGKHLMCDHIARTAPDGLPNMHAHGACLAYR